MTEVLRMGRKTLTIGVILATVFGSMLAAALVAPSKAKAAGCTSGSLIKGPDFTAVYYCGADGKRYVFTNDKNYFTWYTNFNNVQTISAAALGDIVIGGNVTYRPGVKMVKIDSDPRTYVVAHGGVLRHVGSEAVATCLYGATWNKQIDDIADGFFVNYTIGAQVSTCADYDRNNEMSASASVNADMELSAQVGHPTVSSTTPANLDLTVGLGAKPSATFSEAMDSATLNSSTFLLAKGSTSVSGTVSYSDNTATFNPSANLEANSTYTATITTGAKDLEGNALAGGNYSWTFRTNP